MARPKKIIDHGLAETKRLAIRSSNPLLATFLISLVAGFASSAAVIHYNNKKMWPCLPYKVSDGDIAHAIAWIAIQNGLINEPWESREIYMINTLVFNKLFSRHPTGESVRDDEYHMAGVRCAVNRINDIVTFIEHELWPSHGHQTDSRSSSSVKKAGDTVRQMRSMKRINPHNY